jgi:nitrite reductase/ring-hydroxylating ferredoxin subunit
VTLVFPSGLELARLDALPDPGAIVVRVAADDAWGAVILTRKGDTVSAFRNKCPHAGYPLQHVSGRVIVQEGRFLVCSAHGASYALDSGACAGGPCNGEGLQRIDIVVHAGKVMTR